MTATKINENLLEELSILAMDYRRSNRRDAQESWERLVKLVSYVCDEHIALNYKTGDENKS